MAAVNFRVRTLFSMLQAVASTQTFPSPSRYIKTSAYAFPTLFGFNKGTRRHCTSIFRPGHYLRTAQLKPGLNTGIHIRKYYMVVQVVCMQHATYMYNIVSFTLTGRYIEKRSLSSQRQVVMIDIK